MASRPSLSAASLIASPILVAVTAMTLVVATRALVLFASHADAFDLAASIERGGALPDATYLATFVKRNALDRAITDCGDSFTRASLTINLATMEAAGENDDAAATDVARTNALRAAEHRLLCNPLDGNAWLRYAMIKSRGGGDPASVVEDLRMSYWTAPSEGWIVEPRLVLATSLSLSGVSGFETEYLGDLRLYVSFEPASRVAATFVVTSPVVRQQLRPLIDELPDGHKKTIIAEIDALGVDYWQQ